MKAKGLIHWSVLIALFFPLSAIARPEYATRLKMECVSCHAAPWGGGPRTIYGKAYGSRDYTPAKTSSSDLFYADIRTIAFYSKYPTRRMGGFGIMEAAPSANVPVIQNADGTEIRV